MRYGVAAGANPLVGEDAPVSPQNPVRLDEHWEPQPDVAVPRAGNRYRAGELSEPEDILLIIEVADTSLAYDRSVKLPLYARAGIAEVWLVDLNAASSSATRNRLPKATASSGGPGGGRCSPRRCGPR